MVKVVLANDSMDEDEGACWYVQPDGSYKKDGDGRGEGVRREDIPRDAKIVEAAPKKKEVASADDFRGMTATMRFQILEVAHFLSVTETAAKAKNAPKPSKSGPPRTAKPVSNKPGDRVLAKYSDGKFYVAIIKEISGQSATIAWVDNIEAIAKDDVKGSAAVGARIKAKWPGDGKMYPATIWEVKVKRVWLTWDELDETVKIENIKPVDTKLDKDADGYAPKVDPATRAELDRLTKNANALRAARNKIKDENSAEWKDLNEQTLAAFRAQYQFYLDNFKGGKTHAGVEVSADKTLNWKFDKIGGVDGLKAGNTWTRIYVRTTGTTFKVRHAKSPGVDKLIGTKDNIADAKALAEEYYQTLAKGK